MDLNYLYLRHQISLFMSENAACERARETHLAFATAYAERIAGMKRKHVRLAA